jgi:hypothetical protein
MLGIVAGGMLAWAMRRNPLSKKKKKATVKDGGRSKFKL